MKLDHIVLLVGNLERSLPYYEALLSALGFAKSRDHVWGNGDGVYFDFKEATEPGDGYRRYGIGLKPSRLHSALQGGGGGGCRRNAGWWIRGAGAAAARQ